MSKQLQLLTLENGSLKIVCLAEATPFESTKNAIDFLKKEFNWTQNQSTKTSHDEDPSLTHGYNLVLIGSRAMISHYTILGGSNLMDERDEDDISPEKYIEQWLSERERNLTNTRALDWDLIALDALSLIDWIQRNETSIHRITLNHYTKYCGVKKSLKDEVALERAMFISDQDWKELSLKLEMNDRSMVEIELSSDTSFLNEFLQKQTPSNSSKPTSLPQFFGQNEVMVAPLILLQAIKESHIIFPVGDVLKHLKDLHIIKYLSNYCNFSTFERGDFFEYLNTKDPLMKFFYNRFVKTIWASLLQEKISAYGIVDLFSEENPLHESDFETAILDIDDYVKFPNDNHLTTAKTEALDIYDMLENKAEISEYYRSTGDISSSDTSVAYWLCDEVILLALEEFIVPRVMNFNMLSEMILKSIQILWCRYVKTNVAWSIADHMAFIYSDAMEKLRTTEEMIMEELNNRITVSNDMYLTKSDYCQVHEILPSASEFHNEGLALFSSRLFLNSDILFHIFEYIPQYSSLKNLQLLNKECYQFMNGSIFWKRIYFRHWPLPAHYVNSLSELMTDENEHVITPTSPNQLWKRLFALRSAALEHQVEKINTKFFLKKKHFNQLSSILKKRFKVKMNDPLTRFAQDLCYHTVVTSHLVESKLDRYGEEYRHTYVRTTTFLPFTAPFETYLHCCRDYGGYRPGDSKCWGYQSVFDISIEMNHIPLVNTSEKEKLWNACASECSLNGIGNYHQSMKDEKYKALVGTYYSTTLDRRDALSVLSLLMLSFMGDDGLCSIVQGMLSSMADYFDRSSYY